MGNSDLEPARPTQARRLNVLPAAQRELADAFAWCLERFGPRAAEGLLERFEAIGSLLMREPGVGTAVARGRLRLPLQRYPYTVEYLVTDDTVTVLALRHQRRKPRP